MNHVRVDISPAKKGVWVRLDIDNLLQFKIHGRDAPHDERYYTNEYGESVVYVRVRGSGEWSPEKKESFAAELRFARKLPHMW